jgi:hypothetical membrane protein
MKKSKMITWVLSILIATIYIVMTILALANYPEAFSPKSNWLSDLGNRVVSPVGSMFYNSGIYITGSLLALFFLSLGANRIQGTRAQNIMLWLTQGIGIFGSLAMIMTGVFSIDHPQTHSLFSAFLRIGLGTAFGFSVAAFRYIKGFKKWALVIGVITTLTDLFVSVFYNKTHLLEWPVISLFLIYCLLLGNETYRLGKLKNSTL